MGGVVIETVVDGMVEEKAVGDLAPTFVILGTSCPLRMNKDQCLVWVGI